MPLLENADRHPFGAGPGRGECVAISDHVLWFRTVSQGAPMGGVNIWALRDGSGWAIIDTGFADPDTASQWQTIVAQLDGPITRIICTHFHPDHIGQVGTISRQFSVPLIMTEREWHYAQDLAAPHDAAAIASNTEYFRLYGLDDAALAQLAESATDQLTTGLPSECTFLRAGDLLDLGGGSWRVEIGAGHSPAPAMLINQRDGLAIVGDQLLTKITPHIGMEQSAMDADPLGHYLDYLEQALDMPPDMLALPGHGPAFLHVGQRADEIARHHQERLDTLALSLKAPTLIIDTMHTMFGRPLKGLSMILGLTEAHAHLRRLVLEGRADCETDATGRLLFTARS